MHTCTVWYQHCWYILLRWTSTFIVWMQTFPGLSRSFRWRTPVHVGVQLHHWQNFKHPCHWVSQLRVVCNTCNLTPSLIFIPFIPGLMLRSNLSSTYTFIVGWLFLWLQNLMVFPSLAVWHTDMTNWKWYLSCPKHGMTIFALMPNGKISHHSCLYAQGEDFMPHNNRILHHSIWHKSPCECHGHLYRSYCYI